MIICGNCGAINKEEEGKFCRKCGALLPISSRPPRIRIPIQENENEGIAQQNIPKSENETATNEINEKSLNDIPPMGEVQIFTKNSMNNKKIEELQLQKIPEPKQLPSLTQENEEERKEVLKSIPPTPFKGSIISSKKEKTSSQSNPLAQSSYSPDQSEIKNVRTNEIGTKQKQLEEDMSSVLAVLSKKLSTMKEKESITVEKKSEESEKKIPPTSINDILAQLFKLDPYIQGSAIIKEDGTILASALANRISDSLLATIGQNLTLIGTDIIEGLSGGKLKSISIKGSESILDIAPIDKKSPQVNDMILIIFSHSRVKSGIISFAVGLIKKQIKEYLGINK